MKIVFVNDACDNNTFYNKIYKASQKGIGVQGHKFNWLISNGLASNNVEVETISDRPINEYTHKIKYYKASNAIENDVKYNYLGVFNFKFIRSLFILINGYFTARKLINKETVLFCNVLNITSATSALKVAKKRGAKCIGIAADAPEFIDGALSFGNKLVYKNCPKYDGFVFLSKEMTNKFNPLDKPFIVVEGFADCNMKEKQNLLENKYEKNIVLYTGGMYAKYGVKALVEAFIMANIDNCELHLYGRGPYADEVVEISKEHPNVKYMGIVNNDVAVNEQIKSTLLVNPRPTNEEFVKYSFPSKNIEYMASGTPMLTTNLPSMPEEYKEYCFVFDNESVEGMASKLKEILSIDKETLHKKGLEAKDWVLENKNNIVQTKKILDFMNTIEEK